MIIVICCAATAIAAALRRPQRKQEAAPPLVQTSRAPNAGSGRSSDLDHAFSPAHGPGGGVE